jgi:ATP-dependent Clp protease ATP-binding subunit ClpA
MGPFDRFNDRAKRVLALAQDEAVRHRNNFIGTEHLLLGLIREGEGVAAKVLQRLGVDPAKARTALEASIPADDSAPEPTSIVLIPRTKKVIELAIDESRTLGGRYVGTEHLLLGLIREGTSAASEVLRSLEITLERARREVAAVLGELPPEGEAAIPRQTASPFGRFDEQSKQVLANAHDEAVRMGHDAIDTEHLMIALARSEDERFKRIFSELGITLERLRAEVAKAAPPRDRAASPSTSTLTPRLRRVIENSGVEAHARKADRVLPEHLLLALVAEGEGMVAQTLASLGATKERVHAVIDRPPST